MAGYPGGLETRPYGGVQSVIPAQAGIQYVSEAPTYPVRSLLDSGFHQNDAGDFFSDTVRPELVEGCLLYTSPSPRD